VGAARKGRGARDEARLIVALISRMSNLFRARALEREFDDEVRFHLEQRIQQNLRLGMTRNDAEQDAYTRFGSLEQVKAGMREARAIHFAELLVVLLALTAVGGAMLIARRSPVYELTDGVTAPVPVAIAKPEYTPLAKQARVNGAVRVRCIVRPNGHCTDVVVVRSLDTRFGLDAEAVRAVREWRFDPGIRDGSPVATRIDVEVRFALR
jgi:TonB family protein